MKACETIHCRTKQLLSFDNYYKIKNYPSNGKND